MQRSLSKQEDRPMEARLAPSEPEGLRPSDGVEGAVPAAPAEALRPGRQLADSKGLASDLEARGRDHDRLLYSHS